MDARYVASLVDYLANLYGEKFSKPADAMLTLWAEELKSVDRKAMYEAVKRWVRQHRPDYPPTLQGLLDVLDFIQQETEDALDMKRRSQNRETTTFSYVDALEHAAQRAGSAWAHCHVQMVLQGLGSDRNPDETAAQCDAYAAQYPTDAADWHAEAAWWRQGGHGRPLLSTTPGNMYTTSRYEREPGEDDDAPF